MFLCIEERNTSHVPDYEDERDWGWTHYLHWPSLKKVKQVFRSDLNGTGQSVCYGNTQVQIVCSWKCDYHIRRLNSVGPRQQDEYEPILTNADDMFRALGITRIGNMYFVNGWFQTSGYAVRRRNVQRRYRFGRLT